MMDRRQFLSKIGQGSGAFIFTGLLFRCASKPDFQTEHVYTDFQATIAVSGLQKTTKILHLSDSHISVFDESEIEYHPFGRRMDNAYTSALHYKTRQNTTPVDCFMELMETAKSENVDVILLTGDIVNNPSKASVRFILKAVQQTGIPNIYVAGNHDWHYEGMEGSLESLRLTWINNSLLPLYQGSNPLFSSRIIKGINYVTIDNSTYQVNDEQLAFYKKQANRNMPMILLMHIPLYLSKDGEKDSVSTLGDPRWGRDMDKNYEIERRERWPIEGNLPSTMVFIESVKNSKNLVAVLVGHTHAPVADVISETAVQYVAGRAVDGQHRLVTLEPMG